MGGWWDELCPPGDVALADSACGSDHRFVFAADAAKGYAGACHVPLALNDLRDPREQLLSKAAVQLADGASTSRFNGDRRCGSTPTDEGAQPFGFGHGDHYRCIGEHERYRRKAIPLF